MRRLFTLPALSPDTVIATHWFSGEGSDAEGQVWRECTGFLKLLSRGYDPDVEGTVSFLKEVLE